eukprot:scaffold4009_cov124-Cylindrotheca_fusiformis.AAC.24
MDMVESNSSGCRTTFRKSLQAVVLISIGFMLKSVEILLNTSPKSSVRADAGLHSGGDSRLHPDVLYANHTNKTVILPHNQETIPKEAIVKHLPDDKVLVKRRKLLQIEAYYKRFYQKNEYATIYENYLPEPAQEMGLCSIGSKLYYFGGYNETMFGTFNAAVVALGTNRMYVYDMEDMSITQGPNMPGKANHIACAESPDGILHLTGGYHQDARKGQEQAYRRHWILDTTVPLSDVKWTTRTDMPHPRGAHGCRFLADGKMYCIGGGVHQWGPFSNKMMVYDPKTDCWEMGPSMHEAREHISDLVTLWDDQALFVVGGRKDLMDEIPANQRHPYFWTTSYSAEIYDLRTQKWSVVRAPSTPREAAILARYKRHGEDTEPSVLVAGGQRFLGYSGHVINTLDEFDPNTGLYHCHDPLPFPLCGAAMGVWKDKLHIVGGGEWVGISATRRVVIIDLKQAPPPQNCYHKEKPIFDEWNRTYNDAPPFPGILGTKQTTQQKTRSYSYHRQLFKNVLLKLGGKE